MGWVRKLFLSFLHTGKRKTELGLLGKVGGEGQEDCLLFLCSPKSCLTSSSSQLLPLPLFMLSLGSRQEKFTFKFCEKAVRCTVLTTNVTASLHYLGAYELMGHDPAALGAAWTE